MEDNYFTILWWFLPYIDMNQPCIYMCSPSRSPLPPPFPYHPSGSSQCTSPEHLSHASNLGWWSVSPLIVYLFQCYSEPLFKPNFRQVWPVTVPEGWGKDPSLPQSPVSSLLRAKMCWPKWKVPPGTRKASAMVDGPCNLVLQVQDMGLRWWELQRWPGTGIYCFQSAVDL